MISAIAGDILGSSREFNNIDTEEFEFFDEESEFTDDTVLSVASMDVILNNGDYSKKYLEYAQKYPNRGYGGTFQFMVEMGKMEPYNSYGNGSAMRVGPIGFAYDTLEKTIEEAKKSADVSHNHLEGVKGAVAIAGSIFIARKGGSKADINNFVTKVGYDLSRKISDFEQGEFDVTCQGTIPRCIAILMETDNFEQAMRKSVAMGGDVDTNCCIIGSISDALYGLPNKEITDAIYLRIPKEMADITTQFVKKYIDNNFEPPHIKYE